MKLSKDWEELGWIDDHTHIDLIHSPQITYQDYYFRTDYNNELKRIYTNWSKAFDHTLLWGVDQIPMEEEPW